ncbi:MAG: folate family ECF transporter S component [Cellulosilyticum sp.]|nr:folate family ECF transporter S component [Cellulosilyticum sp.]
MQQITVGMTFVVVILALVAIMMQLKKNKMKWQGQSFSIVLTALFVAVSIVLAQFRIYIPLFGFPSVRFSLSEVPIVLTGVLLGGIYGAMAGFASDIISFILVPAGAYHFGFTLNLILVGFIPGVIMKFIKEDKIKVSFDKLNKILGGIALIGALIYINFIGIKELDEVGKIGGVPVNIALSLIMILLIIGLGFIIYKLKQLYSGNEGLYSIDQLLFIMCVNYIVANLVLTPIWILQLYNVPMLASIAVRIFKSLVDVPLQVVVIYTVIHAIPVSMREKRI